MSEWVALTLSVLGIILSAISITYIMYNLQEVFDKIKSLFKRKPKYKVGQKVRVKPDLKWEEVYGTKDNKLKIWMNMTRYVGNVVTIIEIYNDGLFINILEDNKHDTWHADMFESIKIKKEDAFEALLHGHINDEEYTKIMNVGGVVNYVRSWRKNRTHR